MAGVMSAFTAITPLITVKPSAGSAFDIERRALTGNAKPAETALTGSTTVTALAQTSEVKKTERINPELLDALGIKQINKGGTGKATRRGIKSRSKPGPDAQPRLQSGQPQVLDERSALSAALITSIGGRDNQFSEVTLLADWDGREDCTADRELKADDFSGIEAEIDQTITRTAISAHTVANGFNETVFYHGNSNGDGFVCIGIRIGPVCIGISWPALVNTGQSGGVSLLNPIAGDCMDDQVTITGIAVNPVADLGDFGLCDTIGEVVYFSTLDAEGCSSDAANQPFRTRIFALGLMDVPGGIAPVGAIQILRSPLSNMAGLAVDDDGNLYFQLVDLINLQNGGAIFKVTETPRTVVGCGSNPRINRVISSIPNGLMGNIGLGTAVGSTANPVLTSGGFRLTNYSGQSTTFGNIVSLASGQSNVLYAAVARSFNAADDAATRATEAVFSNPSALGPTPSMIISFADCSGGFDSCSSPAPDIAGILPVADGIADVAQSGLTKIPGVNNFRVFALGNGPDIRPVTGGTALVPGTPASVLKVDMQIDFTIHSGIAVNEEGTVFVISGGTPAGVGNNPSPLLGEILCFEDRCPMDRRADFIDFRGDVLPNPPSSGGNIGDGDSDRFDHIFHQAPLDQVTITPAGLAGLARGFLRYTNRLAPNPISPGVTLGVIGGQTVQGDDDTSGPIIFENLDPGHQVAGGDDQNLPFTGDDDDGIANPNSPNNPALTGQFSGGFEFLFGATGTPGSATAPCANNVWNAFFLNSNGNITFNGGDTDFSPTVVEFRSGLPKIAPAWADLNPDARAVDPRNLPVQAMGFAGVNAFIIRWINVPEAGFENCSVNEFGLGGNTFSVTLLDDGTGADENSNKALDSNDPTGDNVDTEFDQQEGPTDFRFTTLEPGDIVAGGSTFTCAPFGACDVLHPEGCPQPFTCARPDGLRCRCVFIRGNNPLLSGTGSFLFSYCRMDLLGTATRPVLTGYSVGGTDALNPPGLCETNLGEAARAADANQFGVIQQQTAIIQPCLIGEGTEPHIFELFNEGIDAGIGSGGEITLATPDFDLRCEGNDPPLCSSVRQSDFNRGKLGFFGIACPPTPSLCATPGSIIIPGAPVNVAPGQPAVGSEAAASQIDSDGNRVATPTSGIINALCEVPLSIIGNGFFPNEATVICQGFQTQTGIPLQRPGKTVTTAVSLTCDTNGDGIADATISLDRVTPVNANLIKARLPVLAPQFSGTAFPLSCCGGLANVVVTTTFTAGDNNIFGPFTRTATCTIDLGVRAPVVVSATGSDGNCSIPQDLLISGSCFILPQGGVTSVFAVERNNPANVIQASQFFVLNANLIDAFFNFGSANAGKTFLIFVTGPGGTSRNLTTLPQGPPAGCPLGNELGVQVTFTCTPEIIIDPPPEGALVFGCDLKRSPSGVFSLVVVGRDFRGGAIVTVGGKSPKKIRFKDRQGDSNLFNKIVLKGGICRAIPGAIIVTNPGGRSSLPFQCNKRCPTQN